MSTQTEVFQLETNVSSPFADKLASVQKALAQALVDRISTNLAELQRQDHAQIRTGIEAQIKPSCPATRMMADQLVRVEFELLTLQIELDSVRLEILSTEGIGSRPHLARIGQITKHMALCQKERQAILKECERLRKDRANEPMEETGPEPWKEPGAEIPREDDVMVMRFYREWMPELNEFRRYPIEIPKRLLTPPQCHIQTEPLSRAQYDVARAMIHHKINTGEKLISVPLHSTQV